MGVSMDSVTMWFTPMAERISLEDELGDSVTHSALPIRSGEVILLEEKEVCYKHSPPVSCLQICMQFWCSMLKP